MTAYMVVCATVTDAERLQHYAQAAERLFTYRGARLLARGAPAVLEGEWPWQGAVVFAWPSRDIAEQVWHSDEYTMVHKLREGAATFQVILLDGETGSEAAMTLEQP